MFVEAETLLYSNPCYSRSSHFRVRFLLPLRVKLVWFFEIVLKWLLQCFESDRLWLPSTLSYSAIDGPFSQRQQLYGTEDGLA